MAKVFIEETTLTAIGDAIRSKTGKTELIDPLNMGTEIESIEAGSGGGDLPEEAFSVTGNCEYRFANGNWNWFVRNYGNKVTTANITNAKYMFASAAGLTEIPFTLNINNANFELCFNAMQKLEKCPKIRGSFDTSAWISTRGMLENCYRLRDAEDLFDPAMLDHLKNVKVTSAYGGGYQVKFGYCYSLRRVPSWWYKQKLSPNSTVIPNSSIAGLYPGCFNYCYSLDEILDIPVWAGNGTATSNMFGGTFLNTCRVKDVTFETDNGTPIIAKWKSQTIDLSSYLGTISGLSSYENILLNYNSGITKDKCVSDDASYQALKNDPDWYAYSLEYGRYNHDSAVNTINSLPDTSAYLATAGGTNTIKFKKAAGSKTDGGAIESLTAEEIAVAAAKGWTVTLV